MSVVLGWFRRSSVEILALIAVACSAGGNAADLESGGGWCAHENATEPCVCEQSAGRRVCRDGTWAACECATSPPIRPTGTGGGPGGVSPPEFGGNGRTDIEFDWESIAQPVLDGACPPGHYEGNLQGIYWSILDPTQIGLPITNIELSGAPSGFHFELAPAVGGEIVQRVEGEVNGLADLLFPFKCKLEGELNCRTGTFTARLYDGSYSVLVDGLLPQRFEGVATGRYDKKTHTFVDGVWDVMETTAVPPGRLAPSMPRVFSRDGYGGAGKFAAALPTDRNDPTLTSCPATFTCGPHLLGPNKMLCNNLLGTPTCLSDADCAVLFPGENVPCLDASLFSLCVRECRP